MRAFWRKEPLTIDEARLLAAVQTAHRASACRDNLSTTALQYAAIGSGDFCQSLTAALATLGGTHAPLEQTHQFLQCTFDASVITRLLNAGRRAPGWGSSFAKEGADPIWLPVHSALANCDAKMVEHLDRITGWLHDAGKKIYPNPSAYTAAAGLVMDIPPKLLPWLFVQGRLAAWAQIFHKQTKGNIKLWE